MERLKLSEADYAALARLARKVDFLAPMTVGQLETLLSHMLLYAGAAGEIVFRHGAAGDAFYIVYEGRVSIRVKKGFFSSARTVSTLGPGDFFGEMALLAREPRTATAVCEEPSRLFVLLSADFGTVLRQNPAFKAEVDQIAARRKFMTAHFR